MTPPEAAALPAVHAAGPPRWLEPSEPDPRRVRALSEALSLPEVMCAVLVARGFDQSDAAKAHLRPLLDHLHPPGALADADVAVRRLIRAIDSGERILVHGDYDVDGVAATALYTRWLRRLGARVTPFVPHRLRDGYDFGEAGLSAARDAGAEVILTADCGVVAHEWIARARDEGIDVVVTDHHTPGEELPPAVAVVDPNRIDCSYPWTGLCGAGIAFKLCTLLGREVGVPFEELVPYLDLVALATVADLVPLEEENRALVRFGLRALARTANPGLRALLEVTGVADGPVGTGQVAFGLAPRINAVGRMGHASVALELLLSDDPEEAKELADHLDETNRSRREEDRRTLGEALEMLAEDFDPDEDYGVVLASSGWHPGVIGIVASRVVERIHRPVVMVALDGDVGRGSARSIPGFHLYDALRACASHLDRFGGHRQAAGMDLGADAVPALREAFNAEARRRLDPEDLRPRLRIDLELPGALDGLDLELADRLRHLGPHGIGNPRPVFLVRSVEAKRPRVVGSGHLKLRLVRDGRELEAIGFGLAERLADRVHEGTVLDAVFQLGVNDYRGRRTVQARLLDLRPAGSDGDGGGTDA